MESFDLLAVLVLTLYTSVTYLLMFNAYYITGQISYLFNPTACYFPLCY